MADPREILAQYEGTWATKPTQVKEGIMFSYYSPGAKDVYVSGDFNGWKHGATKLIKGGDDVWRVILHLVPNRWYDYKYIVDGDWITDPNNPDLNPDTAGGANSVVYIGAKGNLLSEGDPERFKFTLEGRGIKHDFFVSPKYNRKFDVYYVNPKEHSGEQVPVVICLNNYIKSQEIQDYCREYGYIGVLPAPEIGGDYIRKGKPRIFSELVDYVKERFSVDENRIYLTGMSNGGLEAYLASMYYPDLIAASAFVFGPYKLRYYKEKIENLNAKELGSFIQSLDFPQRMLTNLENLPVYISHGGGDEAVPADDAIVLHAILDKLGAPVKMEYYPDQGHTWLMVDKDLPRVFDWFDGRELNKYPKKFSYTSPFGVFKTRIYWAEIMPFEVTQPVSIAVAVKGKNSVEIEARNIKKIVLKPDRSILDVSGKLNIKANKELVQTDSNKDTNEVVITF